MTIYIYTCITGRSGLGRDLCLQRGDTDNIFNTFASSPSVTTRYSEARLQCKALASLSSKKGRGGSGAESEWNCWQTMIFQEAEQRNQAPWVVRLLFCTGGEKRRGLPSTPWLRDAGNRKQMGRISPNKITSQNDLELVRSGV